MYTRRPFAVLASTIVLVAVALLSSSRGIGVSVTRAAHAALAAVQEPANPTIDRTGRATEPDGSARAAFLHANRRRR